MDTDEHGWEFTGANKGNKAVSICLRLLLCLLWEWPANFTNLHEFSLRVENAKRALFLNHRWTRMKRLRIAECGMRNAEGLKADDRIRANASKSPIGGGDRHDPSPR